MTISELIEKLEAIRTEYGDLEVKSLGDVWTADGHELGWVSVQPEVSSNWVLL